jgi:amino acid transporter
VSASDPKERARQFNLEFRVADATASPYLALAMLVQAGLDGVRHERQIPRDPSALPTSLAAALVQLEATPGFGMAFSILCFAGFEGAATLAEETFAPRRNIPVALFGTVLGSAVFFIFVAYCEVVGYGPTGIQALANSQAPLNDLALRFASTPMAVALDIAAATSCFAGVLGGLAAAGRVLFATTSRPRIRITP